MFNNLMKNLSKTQKIGFLVVIQAIIIITLLLIVQMFTKDNTHVTIQSDTDVSSSMPRNAEEFIESNIWEVVKDNVLDSNSNEIDDVVIREGTYQEEEQEDGSVEVSFIVDIDSLKQSYTVQTGWSKNGKTIYEVIVNCPKLEDMKYPETICYGMYNNSYSLDLYLPYTIYPDGYDDEDAEVVAPDVLISNDDDTKTIDVMVSKCDAEKFIEEANQYLKKIPIDISDYVVKYHINEINVGC